MSGPGSPENTLKGQISSLEDQLRVLKAEMEAKVETLQEQHTEAKGAFHRLAMGIKNLEELRQLAVSDLKKNQPY